MVANLRDSKHAEILGFEAPRTRLHPFLSVTTKVALLPGITSEDVRKSDLLAELTDIMPYGVSQDLWILSIGIDNNPWGQYQPLIPTKPNPFEIILLQITRKENNWKTEETLERAVVTLETERIKGSSP